LTKIIACPIRELLPIARAAIGVRTAAREPRSTWLRQQLDPGESRVLVHGMITYDYFNVLRAVRTPDHKWKSDAELRRWTPVDHPISLVLFGKSPESPAGDDADGDD
jgi:hypothetical protein